MPVLLTAHGWDPNTSSVRDWLRDQLTMTYPLFAHRGGRAEAAALAAARDKVALILDGLDEMDQALRPAALQALSDATFRVIVLTRSQELVQAAAGTWLAGAVAVHLRGVSAPDAADYLQRARTGPPPEGWTDLLTDLSEQPNGVLAGGLSTPLILTLLRDTYQAGDDVRKLLDPADYSTADAIEQHLIARILPAAYTPRPGRPPPRYTEQQGRQTLTFIAQQMGKNRDLAWWHIPRWAPTAPRVLALALVIGLTGGLVAGLVALVGWLAGGLLMGLGLAGGCTSRLASALSISDAPKRVRTANWRAAISRQTLSRSLAGGLLLGLVGGLLFWLTDGEADGLGVMLTGGLAVGLAFGLTVGLAVELTNALTERGTGAGLPMDPCQVWRNDRLSGLVEGLVGGLGGSVTGPTTLAWLQLSLSRRVPAVSLMPFLEDARERDILRTVGAVYQFRHARLQDQLASETTASTAMPPAVSHQS